MQPRYVIIGAGAVGLALAAEFHLAGVPCVVVARGVQLKRLVESGLDYLRPGGRRKLRIDVAEQQSLRLNSADVLLLCVKAQDVDAVTSEWASLPVQGGGVAADLPLVTFQNGLAAERIASRRFLHVYGASIKVPAVHLEPGKVAVAAKPHLAVVTVGRFPFGRDGVTGALVRDLITASNLAEERDDIQRWKAAKLLHNVKNVLEIFSGDPATHADAAEALVSEAQAAITAAGLEIARADESRLDLSGWVIDRDSIAEPAGQSTWQSFARGVGSEVDYLNGEIVLLGALHDVPTPWNRAVQRLAARMAAAGAPPGSLDISELLPLTKAAA